MFTKKVKNKKKVRIQRESHEEGDDGGEIHNGFVKERDGKNWLFLYKSITLLPLSSFLTCFLILM